MPRNLREIPRKRFDIHCLFTPLLGLRNRLHRTIAKPKLAMTFSCCLAILLTGSLSGCARHPDLLTEIKAQGVLKIVTRNGPTTYYINRGQPTGFEYTLTKAFADYLGVDLKVISVNRLDDVYEMLDRRRAHMVAAGLRISPERESIMHFGPQYMTVKNFLIYRRGKAKAREISDLYGKKIKVLADSSQAQALKSIKPDHPKLEWSEVKEQNLVQLLDELNRGVIDFTIVDSNQFIAKRGFYPQLRVGFAVGEPGKLAWGVSQNDYSHNLVDEMHGFFELVRKDGRLASWIERHYGHNEGITQIHSQTFLEAVNNRLPKYRNMIEEVAREYGIDWRLLAAVAYQESYWNPKARSPTGVRGMMMLTMNTAAEMGIENRMDARQSLEGGAKYLQYMRRRIPKQIREPDRSWFALASYNVGFGHLRDARILVARAGGNPDRWNDVKDYLPLLRKPEYFRTVNHGFARGDEPVRYVQNIRHYYSLLSWQEINKVSPDIRQKVADYVPKSIINALPAL